MTLKIGIYIFWPNDYNLIKIPVTLKQEKFSNEYKLTAIQEGGGGGGGGEQVGKQNKLKLVLPFQVQSIS